MQNNKTPSTLVMILQLIGYLLVFAVPTTIAALSWPAHVAKISVAAGLLFFAVSSFHLGWQWRNPERTPLADVGPLWWQRLGILLYAFVAVAVYNGIGSLSHRTGAHPGGVSFVIACSGIVASSLVGFFAGLWMRRYGQQAQT